MKKSNRAKKPPTEKELEASKASKMFGDKRIVSLNEWRLMFFEAMTTGWFPFGEWVNKSVQDAFRQKLMGFLDDVDRKSLAPTPVLAFVTPFKHVEGKPPFSGFVVTVSMVLRSPPPATFTIHVHVDPFVDNAGNPVPCLNGYIYKKTGDLLLSVQQWRESELVKKLESVAVQW